MSAAFAALTLACSPSIPDDTFSCDTDADCPPGFACRESYCRSGDASDGGDGGPADAGADDAGDSGDEGDAGGDGGDGGDGGGECAASEEICDGLDDDCDDIVDEGVLTRFYADGDEDGHGDALVSVMACEAPDGYVTAGDDCNDSCPVCRPGGTEVCEGSLDENCSMGVDDGCACASGTSRACPGGSSQGACMPGTQTCTPAGEWGACVGAVGPTTEVCNSIDDDCDGATDGPVASVSCPVVARAARSCSAGGCVITSCDPGSADCDATYANGCEAALGTALHCGACGISCGWDCESSSCNDIVSIGAGISHTCALRQSGEVVCWGDNLFGQLGNGTTTSSLTPVAVSGVSNATALSVGYRHSCALLSSGGVRCWGNNSAGQLGDSTTSMRTAPVAVGGLSSEVAAISAGNSHTCALLAMGGLRCWGSNTEGQLGDGTTTNRALPVAVSGVGGTVMGISAGGFHTCITLSTGAVKCWGGNSYGALGDGTMVRRTAPTAVMGLSSGVAQVSAGTWHTCALLASGGVRCWGANNRGAAGDGTTVHRLAPVGVTGLASGGVAALSASDGYSCAALTTGAARCWGRGDFLGDGGDTADQTSPVAVVGVSGAVAINAGGAHSCVVHATGGGRCWGANSHGQLGDRTTVNGPTPVVVLPP